VISNTIKLPRVHQANAEVVEALERLLEAARAGAVRAVSVVVVNPLHEVETVTVGNIHQTSKILLIGGLSVAAQELLQT
jgi:hypothetical protein